jgi:hypothetical protein
VQGDTIAAPVARSIHGFEFVAQLPITVTHLGYFDYSRDGLRTDHPIGLFRLSDAALLTSGLMSAGTSDLLVGDYRYVDTSDVTLTVGESYVVSYYTDKDQVTDYDPFVYLGSLAVNPAILYTQARWDYATSLGIPQKTASDFRAANFLFAVPEPDAAVAMGICLLCCSAGEKLRSRRSAGDPSIESL